ncbi:MAG: short-chain dehydrogenase, partial [Alphaproteobacteria bacterium]|nr:short-chain dehydrogenase [Alphaproteobacteria bacterium]
QGQIRASGVNPVSKIRKRDLIPVEDPARGIAYLCSAEADDLAGHELDLNDRELRRRIGIRLL